MNYIDLFAGIGGFHLGAKWARWKFKNSFYSEVDEYCNKLYKQNFPESIELGDIKKIDCEKLKKKYGKRWIITGGFPCQDLSIAGQKKGIRAERSGLWFEMLRIISRIRPKFCIIENVSGLIISGGLGVILSGLAEIGYDAEWQSISASQIGAFHKRERIWIIAYPISKRPYKSKIQGRINNQASQKKYGKKSIFQRFISGVVSFENWENDKYKSDRELDGISRELDRIKGLGNAIVPQIAMILFLQIKESIKNN